MRIKYRMLCLLLAAIGGGTGTHAQDLAQAAVPPAGSGLDGVRTLPADDVFIPAPAPMSIPDGFTIERNIPYDKWSATVLDVCYPSESSAERRPGVVMFHGGGWVNAGRAGKESMRNAFVLPYLEHGFVVCNVEYRVASQGLAPAAVIDARQAAQWFFDHADRYHVDVGRLVATGASAGGHLALTTAMIPASETDLGPAIPFAAVCNGYGITDVVDVLEVHRQAWASQWIPPELPGRLQLAKRISPMSWVRKDLPPIFTFQGENDRAVPYAHGVALTQAVKDAGGDAVLFTILGAGHGPGRGQWPMVNEQVFEFLRTRGILTGPSSEVGVAGPR